MEAEPLRIIIATNMTRFVWQNIVYLFGSPEVLLTDNRTQFDCDQLRSFCKKLNVRNHYSSLAHPQANGQVKVTNRTIIQGMKKKLEGKKEEWVEELPVVLMSYKTTVRTPTGETPYSLVYRTEAALPIERKVQTYRVKQYRPNKNTI